MSDWGIINVNDGPRGDATQPAKQLFIRAMDATFAWGLAPGNAVITYVAQDLDSPLAVGAFSEIQLLGKKFYGIVQSDMPVDASSGKTRQMQYLDLRLFLDWDVVFGAFNKAETRTVNGERVRRYWHIYPADAITGIKTFTNAPLTAAQILNLLFNAGTVGSPWQRTYHADQFAYPVFDIDFLAGAKLSQAVSQITEMQGLVVAPGWMLAGGETAHPYSLTWVRKGEGAMPLPVDGDGYLIFPEDTDDQRRGVTLSLAPTRCFVVGDRNRYQVLNVSMRPDWNRNYEEFWDLGYFIQWVFENLTLNAAIGGIGAGTRYNAVPGDTEGMIGGQLAFARAMEMTVGQLAVLRGGAWADTRLYAGRCRMDLPVALYLSVILFRAFRPPATVTLAGFSAPLHSLALVPEQLAQVTLVPDANTTPLRYDIDDPLDGQGYAAIKGYQVGSDLFKLVRPDRFNVAQWSDTQNIWQAINYSIDQSGEDGGYILFDQPVINSGDFLTAYAGYRVPVANPTFNIPPCCASLTFEGPRFRYVTGSGSLDMAINAGLRREFMVSGGVSEELALADGSYPNAKAQQLANAALARQWAYLHGGYTIKLRPASTLPHLMSTVDRLQIQISDAGQICNLDFTGERGRNFFEPERDYEHRSAQQTVFPGQGELRQQANAAKLIAVGLKSAPQTAKTVAEAFSGGTERVTVTGGSAGVSIDFGTPLWKEATVSATGSSPNTTRVVLPAVTTIDHAVLGGVTVIHNWPSNTPAPVVTQGACLAWVRGPVEPYDPVGKPPDEPGSGLDEGVLTGTNPDPAVGVALQSVADGEDALIQVLLGAGGGGNYHEFKLCRNGQQITVHIDSQEDPATVEDDVIE